MKCAVVLVATLAVLINPFVAAQTDTRSADQLTMKEKIEYGKPFHTIHNEPVEPFTVIGNIHSVGAKNVGIYLVTTNAGHVLIDTGVSGMHDSIKQHIKQLGFVVGDIKIILSTHAHFDHVQGHEAMRKATGAEVMAVGLDAEALRLGKDISPLGFEGWEPVAEVTTLAHGDKVQIGSTVLTAHAIPGHTQGCTVWTLPVMENRQVTNVAIFGCRGPNGIVKVKNNPDFPGLVDQTLLGFQRLAEIEPEIYLSNHPQADMEKYGATMMAGERPHPLLQQTPWQEMVQSLVDAFNVRIQ